MTATMMMDRTTMGMPTMTTGGKTVTGMSPTGTNYLMVPRCTFKVEKIANGVKMTCVCDDPTARSMAQNLCVALMGGMVSCCCSMNGVAVCTVNFTMGACRCEVNDTGVCVTCTSGDAECCKMIQSCCECLTTCMNAGCACCVTVNGTPMCCGYGEGYGATTTTTPKPAKK